MVAINALVCHDDFIAETPILINETGLGLHLGKEQKLS